MFKPVELQVSEKQRAILQALSRSSAESHRIVERSKLLLYIIDSDNRSSLKVKQELGSSEKWVKQWRKRWSLRQAGLAQQEASLSEKAYRQAVRGALEDAERSGAPPTYSVEQQCRLRGWLVSHPRSRVIRSPTGIVRP